jgi:hypothetical protein
MKIYTDIVEIEKDFFPALYKERMKKIRDAETPEETGARWWRESTEKLTAKPSVRKPA